MSAVNRFFAEFLSSGEYFVGGPVRLGRSAGSATSNLWLRGMKRTPLDIIREVFHAENDELGNGADLRELAGWDSLNHMTFIAALEREYDVVLTGDEIAEMLNLEVINRILRNKHGLRL